MARRKAQLKIQLPTTIPNNEGLKLKIGNDIIKAIQKRTKSGKNKLGQAFKKYSDSYKKSEAFKAFGKSGSKVNLKLSGDMLDLMEIRKVKGREITIGWDPSDGQDGKVENHINGVTLPKRDFLGIRPKELSTIIKKNKTLIDRIEQGRATERDEQLLEAQIAAEEL